MEITQLVRTFIRYMILIMFQVHIQKLLHNIYYFSVGVVDGKHINIKKPRRTVLEEYNMNEIPGLVIMAACDAKYIFRTATVTSNINHIVNILKAKTLFFLFLFLFS